MKKLERLVNGAKNMFLVGAACFIPGLMNIDSQAQTNDHNWEVRYYSKVKNLNGDEIPAVAAGSTNILEVWADKPVSTEYTTSVLGGRFYTPLELELKKGKSIEENGVEDIFWDFQNWPYSSIKVEKVANPYGEGDCYSGFFNRAVDGYPRIGINTGKGVVAKYEFVVSPELTNDIKVYNISLRDCGATYNRPSSGSFRHEVAQKSLPLVVYKDPDASFSYLLTDKHDGNKEHPVDDHVSSFSGEHTPVQTHFSITGIVNNMPLMEHKLQKASSLDGSWTDVSDKVYYTGTDVGGCHSFDCTPEDNKMGNNSGAVGPTFYRIKSGPLPEGFMNYLSVIPQAVLSAF